MRTQIAQYTRCYAGDALALRSVGRTLCAAAERIARRRYVLLIEGQPARPVALGEIVDHRNNRDRSPE